MVIRSNRGFVTPVSPSVLGLSYWVGMVTGDLDCSDGTMGFSGLVVSYSCIESEPFRYYLIVIGLTRVILINSIS
jgi:hypothetical protein